MATQEEVEVAWCEFGSPDKDEYDRMSRAIDAVDALRARTLDGPGWLIEPTTLAACPIGLFMYGEELCLKTEYGNNEGRIDAYIVSSGEFFWGAPPQTIASQRKQLVRPIPAIRAAHAHMQGASLGYVVRWEALGAPLHGGNAYVGKFHMGYICRRGNGTWAWLFLRRGDQREEVETEALAKSALLATIAEYMKGFGLPPSAGTFNDGLEAARKAFAALVRDYKRDASFDDNAVGAAEHQANQENIARAIEGAALKRSQDQEAGL